MYCEKRYTNKCELNIYE